MWCSKRCRCRWEQISAVVVRWSWLVIVDAAWWGVASVGAGSDMEELITVCIFDIHEFLRLRCRYPRERELITVCIFIHEFLRLRCLTYRILAITLFDIHEFLRLRCRYPRERLSPAAWETREGTAVESLAPRSTLVWIHQLRFRAKRL